MAPDSGGQGWGEWYLEEAVSGAVDAGLGGRLLHWILIQPHPVVEGEKSPTTTESPRFNSHSWGSGQGHVLSI